MQELASLPMRGRGLKCECPRFCSRCRASLPMRGRGLKYEYSYIAIIRLLVAPHAGAWIEILDKGGEKGVSYVAPHAGAWIEM